MAARGWKRALRFALIGVGVGVMAWTLWRLGPRRVLDVALEADARWLGLSVVAVLFRFLLWGVKWNRMLARRARVPFRDTLRIVGAGAFVNLTTPTAKLAGGIVRAALLRRRGGWGWAPAYGWALADQITNVLGNLAFASALVLALAPTFDEQGGLLAGTGLVGLGLVVAVGHARGWLWERIERPTVHDRLESWIPQRLRRMDGDRHGAGPLRELLRPLLREGGAWRGYASDVALGGLGFSSMCVANALVFRALGIDASWLELAGAVVLGYLVGVVIGIWGGIGVTEAALTAFYVKIGVDKEAAAAAALLHRAAFYGVVCVWGGLSLLREGRPRLDAELP